MTGPAARLFTSDSCQSLYRFWDGLRQGRRCPDWADVDVTALKPWMGWLFIVDFPDRDSDDGHFTLVGTEIARRFNTDYTGWKVTEVGAVPRPDRLRQSYGQARRSGKPLVSVNVFESPRGPIPYERVLLPFARLSRDPVDRLLACMDFALERPASDDWLGQVSDTLFQQETVIDPS